MRVLSTEPTLKLEIISRDSPSGGGAPLDSVRSPAEPVEALLSRVFASAGRLPEPALVQQLLLFYRRLYGEPKQEPSFSRQIKRMRGLLEVVDRSLGKTASSRGDGWSAEDATAIPDLENLLQWLGGIPGGQYSGGGGNRSGKPQNESEEGEAFGRYVQRAVSLPDHLLQLYNALAPGGDVHWVTVPLRVLSDVEKGESRIAVDAVLKVGWHLRRRRSEVAVLSVRRNPGELWWFRWSRRTSSGGGGMKLVDAGSDGAGEDCTVDPNLLARLGFTGHTGGVGEAVECDGFELRPVEAVPIPRVDTYG